MLNKSCISFVEAGEENASKEETTGLFRKYESLYVTEYHSLKFKRHFRTIIDSRCSFQ